MRNHQIGNARFTTWHFNLSFFFFTRTSKPSPKLSSSSFVLSDVSSAAFKSSLFHCRTRHYHLLILCCSVLLSSLCLLQDRRSQLWSNSSLLNGLIVLITGADSSELTSLYYITEISKSHPFKKED